ncbi:MULTISPECIES: FAD-binding monooxygenase [Alphaproteobacteria]|uniref:Phenol 2-monooxygenase n=2 Tax=Alphaproteobacteria TaxID=28211 RepID=A0A512HFZ8_9HYPH|nr:MULTISPECIES: FAD-binding monooxygenase [Alphaproteobacteria]GEO84361.1 phenol 2-monooxygenase [Ciceribacter naphthalenivorans]GLR24898.1 phenol 2-monooxygenase [Ciceribacter naphthalenivorans]GLT07754.1 phenol 2-monooxygenase [Sphingomonas psychrolutea]
MQFHLNGFRTGDPAIAEPLLSSKDDGHAVTPSGEVDVLIVGSGPAGLTLAAQLCAFPGITTRIVEQRDRPLTLGQADGIACRTMEMFNAFGFADRVLREAYFVNETTFWKPDDAGLKTIVRHGRIEDTEDGLSEFPHVILNQARVHDFYLDVMRNAPQRLEPDYARRLLDLEIDPSATSGYPVTVRLERLDGGHEGEVETVKARYVVGCDGARSAVRKAIGRELKGDSANQAWGVMDVLAVTDFPDIRLKAAIHSANEGNILIIPREGGYLVRLYIELDKLKADERVSNRAITADQLVAAAKRILHPYTLDVKEIAWWSVYEIGQRLTDKFDDVPDGHAGQQQPRVFIAGDACHTHSPKAGQGMNVSMQDTFNLGWKLAAVLRGIGQPELLDTYSAERQAIAKELIDFDREFAKMFSAPPKGAAGAGADAVDPQEFQRYFVKQGRFTAGTATRYRPSIIQGEPTHQHLAEGFTIGMRFHSAPVVRLADAKLVQLGHVAEADGRFRLYAFAGREDPAAPTSAIRSLCDFLARSPQSPMRRFTPAGTDVDALIDLRAIFQQGHRTLSLDAMPDLLRPAKGRHGLIDYEKMFCPDLKNGPDIFDLRGVDRESGCVVVVRPDQYVAHVLPLDAYDALAAYFEGFMVARG